MKNDSLNLTLDQALEKLPDILKKDLNKNLCVCNEVKKMDIIHTIVSGANTVAEVRKQTYATMGSACCKQQVERLIECLCEDDEQYNKRNK